MNCSLINGEELNVVKLSKNFERQGGLSKEEMRKFFIFSLKNTGICKRKTTIQHCKRTI